jgi:hypothetical protein
MNEMRIEREIYTKVQVVGLERRIKEKKDVRYQMVCSGKGDLGEGEKNREIK